jgi:hypothetical protein
LRKWLVEVAFEYGSRLGEASEITSGAPHGYRVDVGGVQLDLLQGRRHSER